VELGVCPGTGDVAGVPDVVAWLEQRDLVPDLDDGSRGVETEDPSLLRVPAAPDLVIDRVHRHGVHLHEDVLPHRFRVR
jgi:hypothetical protein